MKKTIFKEFVKADKFKHFEFPFSVPEGIESLDLQIEIISKIDQEAVIDIGIKDENCIRGWTGSNKKNIIINGEYATPGYAPGKINKGEWAFLLSVYKVPDTGCKVKLIVELHKKQYRWLKGDTHFHTCHSDGDSNIFDFVKICKEIGFDYLITTNHNTVTQNLILPSDMGITLIPGIELTTYHGHANLLGLKKPINDYRCTSKQDIIEKFEETKKKGGFTGINHPCADDNEGCVWDWEFDLKYDWLEVWNDLWSYMNENALKLWNSFLCEGIRLPVIGGSDNHKLKRYRTDNFPVTYVYTDSNNRESILNAFVKGYCFISLKEGPLIDLNAGSDLMGDITKEKTVNYSLAQLKMDDEIHIITDKGIESKVISDNSGKIKGEFIRTDQKFLRIEVRRKYIYKEKFQVALISNPIYFET